MSNSEAQSSAAFSGTQIPAGTKIPAGAHLSDTNYHRAAALPLVIMGVSGSGKSTFGAALALALGMSFVEGDDLHSASNLEKMRRGHPLEDDDREPWLRAIAAVLKDHASHPNGVVVACSALKRRYRDTLRAARGLRFVFLDADRRLAEERIEARQRHFMPPALIASQFAALERPDDAETDVVLVDARLPVGAAVRAAVDLLGKRSPTAETQEQSILRSWDKNAVPWTRAVREERIDSRTHVTNRAIIETLLALPVRRVLDVGCGEGWLARALGRERIAVTGVDATPSLIAEARRLGGGFFAVRSYEDLAIGRFEHRDFDAAVCNFSLLGEDSVERLCHALHRYLAPSGYLIIQTLHPLASRGTTDPYCDGWRTGTWSGFGAEFTDPAPWYFRTLSSWLTLLRRSGYQLIDCREPAAPEVPAPSSIIFVGRSLSPDD